MQYHIYQGENFVEVIVADSDEEATSYVERLGDGFSWIREADDED